MDQQDQQDQQVLKEILARKDRQVRRRGHKVRQDTQVILAHKVQRVHRAQRVHRVQLDRRVHKVIAVLKVKLEHKDQ